MFFYLSRPSRGLLTYVGSDPQAGRRGKVAWLTVQSPMVYGITLRPISEKLPYSALQMHFILKVEETHKIIGILGLGSRCSLWLRSAVLINNVGFCWLQKSFELICFKDFSKESSAIAWFAWSFSWVIPDIAHCSQKAAEKCWCFQLLLRVFF